MILAERGRGPRKDGSKDNLCEAPTVGCRGDKRRRMKGGVWDDWVDRWRSRGRGGVNRRGQGGRD